jgi:5-methylcytosine-specific restriction endonuclease McrA
MKRSGPLRARSAKTEALYVQRRRLVAALLEQFPWCQIRFDDGCEGRAVEVDEVKARSAGGSILDSDNTVTTCRHCHRQKHLHPAEAIARGFTVRSWERREMA